MYTIYIYSVSYYKYRLPTVYIYISIVDGIEDIVLLMTLQTLVVDI